MNINTGHIGAEDKMKKIYGENAIKPIPIKSLNAMRNWGKKKRVRYAELLDMGKDTLEAFELVEFHRGNLTE